MSDKLVLYRHNLPHIHPEGYPLFITFRLADSLPTKVLAELRSQREQELVKLKGHSDSERYQVEKKYFGRYDDWLDLCEHGPRWLEEGSVAQIVADKMHNMDRERYLLNAFCIMPNHAHVLFKPILSEPANHQGKSARYPASETMRLLKGSTAHDCNLELKRSGKFWHHESYDHYVRDESEMARIIHYIRNNPVKAGLVKNWRDWPYSYVSPESGEW